MKISVILTSISFHLKRPGQGKCGCKHKKTNQLSDTGKAFV